MKILVLIVLSLGLVGPVAANSESEQSFLEKYKTMEFPENFTRQQGGYEEAPVIPCPRPSERYAKLVSELENIKATIKSEACKESDLEAASFEELFGEDRVRVIDLLKKGAFGEGQLTSDEVGEAKGLVTKMINSVAVVTGAVDNAACFSKDEKKSTLSFLSAIVGDFSAAIGTFAGPFGAKISLGGELASVVLKSLDQIQKARQTYDYKDWRDTNRYLNNLCTYYDLKADLDKESDLIEPHQRLSKIITIAEAYLAKVEDDCSVCSLIINDYQNKMKARQGFDFRNVRETELNAPQLSSIVDSRDLRSVENVPWVDKVRYYRELYDYEFAIEPEQSQEALQDYIELPQQNDVKFVQAGWFGNKIKYIYREPPKIQVPMLSRPEATVRALEILTWAEKERDALQGHIDEGMGQHSRGGVAKIQREIEKFLVNREAPAYLRSIASDLKSDIRKLTNMARIMDKPFRPLTEEQENDPYVANPSMFKGDYEMVSWRNNLHGLSYFTQTSLPLHHLYELFDRDFLTDDFDYSYEPGDIVGPIRNVFHKLWLDEGNVMNIIDQALNPTKYSSDLELTKASIKKMLRLSLSDLIDGHGLVLESCDFFQNSAFRYDIGINKACSEAKDVMAEAQHIVDEIWYTSFEDGNAFILEVFERARPNYVADWESSVIYALARDAKSAFAQ